LRKPRSHEGRGSRFRAQRIPERHSGGIQSYAASVGLSTERRRSDGDGRQLWSSARGLRIDTSVCGTTRERLATLNGHRDPEYFRRPNSVCERAAPLLDGESDLGQSNGPRCGGTGLAWLRGAEALSCLGGVRGRNDDQSIVFDRKRRRAAQNGTLLGVRTAIKNVPRCSGGLEDSANSMS
jgi:hypothetical protein